MTEDHVTHNMHTGAPEYRRTVVARYGHFRIDRLWYRTPPNYLRDCAHYHVVFEVDTDGEFGMGATYGSDSETDQRLSALYLAWLFRRANSPPPASRPTSLPYYRRRVWTLGPGVEGTPAGEWYMDSFFVRPDRSTIDVEEAASLVESALPELEESESGA